MKIMSSPVFDANLLRAVDILDSSGLIKATAPNGEGLEFTAALSGTYYVKLTSQTSAGSFIRSYSMTATVVAPDGVAETEPNDSLSQATSLGQGSTFRGTLATNFDKDYYSFQGKAGQAAVVKFADQKERNPSVTLYDTFGATVAIGSGGLGLAATLPFDGIYKLCVASDNDFGAVKGQYVGNVVVSDKSTTEAEPNSTFDSATVLPPVISTSFHAVGVLSDVSDIDTYAVDLVAGNIYEFRMDQGSSSFTSNNRRMTLYNEFGQYLGSSYDGMIASGYGGWNLRVETTARHYITIQSTGPSGVGAYTFSGRLATTFPTQRDVALVYQDLTANTRPEVNPQLIAHFDSQFSNYDLEVTTSDPGSSTDHVKWTLTTSANIAGGGVGSGYYGVRRPKGEGHGNVDVSYWAKLNDSFGGITLAVHEVGHGVGLGHLRDAQSSMSLAGHSDGIFMVGSAYWMCSYSSDPSMPGSMVINERDYLDWILTAGRIALESEPNGTIAQAQSLDGYLAEMSTDADPRNDQVTVAGRIASAGDTDTFAFQATAGQSFTVDIDSAEFQNPLDSTLQIYDSSSTLLATSTESLDPNSGLDSVDPSLTYKFTTAGTYYAKVVSAQGTFGDYRLRLTPERAYDRTGPRVYGTWPDGGSVVDSTRQLTVWFDDQVNPATLTSANVVVTGALGGVQKGVATFDPTTCAMIWTADKTLPADTYIVTLKGVTDLRGNLVDGEGDGTLNWPEVSGNGSAGGDFATRFQVNAPDTTPAKVTYASYDRHPNNRGLFTLQFSDELDIVDINRRSLTLRGAGPDRQFSTADDLFLPSDLTYSEFRAGQDSMLYLYSRGIPDAGLYRVEGTVLDAAGNSVTVSQAFTVLNPVPSSALGTTSAMTTAGLTGSYVNKSLWEYTQKDDWRSSQTIAGTRVDSSVNFNEFGWYDRSGVNITGGTDDNWDNFSVQWDGYIKITTPGTRLYTSSDDGSRLWIDINGDGVFNNSGDEFLNNNWGIGQAVTTSPASLPLPAGVYHVRMQYYDMNGPNKAYLEWDDTTTPSADRGGYLHGPTVNAQSIPAGGVATTNPDFISIDFSGSLDVATLTTANFKLRYSPDPTFFDANDTFITDADGQIGWDPTHNRATFKPTSLLTNGYYMVDLNGGTNGIKSVSGRLLDGEFLNTDIAGSTSPFLWKGTPSGDGVPGGSYRAYFRVNAPYINSTITIDSSNSNSIYGQSLTFTATVEPTMSGGPTLSGTVQFQVDGVAFGPAVAIVNGKAASMSTTKIGAGAHSITALYSGDSLYVGSSASMSQSESKAHLTVKGDLIARTYGQANPPLTATISGFVNNETLAVVSGSPVLATIATKSSNVDNYPITVDVGTLSASNYDFPDLVPGILMVSQAQLKVTALSQTRSYGQPNPSLGVSISGFVNGDSQAVLTGSALLGTVATQESPVGTYAITVQVGSLSAVNYHFNEFVEGSLLIYKAPLTIKADAKTRVYGQTNPALTASISGFVMGETAAGTVTGSPSVTTLATAKSGAGKYPIFVSVGSLRADNYKFVTFTPSSLTVSKAPLTVKADDYSRLYGQNNPKFTATISGFVNGDTAAVVSGLPGFSSDATTASVVNVYRIISSAGSLSAANYDFSTFTDGKLSVTKAPLSVAVDRQTRSYGSANPTLTYTFQGFVLGENAITAKIGGSPVISTPANATSPAGVYPITAALGTLAAANYQFQLQDNEITINPAPLSISADNKTMTTGGPVPTLTVSYSGFVNGEGPGNLIAIPTISTTATVASLAGSYPITASGTKALNYLIRYQPGTLTVSPPPTLTVQSATLVKVMVGKTNTTAIAIAFSGELDTAKAVKLAIYKIALAGKDKKFGTKDDVVTQIKSVTCDAATKTVRLVPKTALASTLQYQLIVMASLTDKNRRPLDGNGDGKTGDNFSALLPFSRALAAARSRFIIPAR